MVILTKRKRNCWLKLLGNMVLLIGDLLGSLELGTRFEKSTTDPTHYVRIYIEMGLVIYIRKSIK